MDFLYAPAHILRLLCVIKGHGHLAYGSLALRKLNTYTGKVYACGMILLYICMCRRSTDEENLPAKTNFIVCAGRALLSPLFGDGCLYFY